MENLQSIQGIQGPGNLIKYRLINMGEESSRMVNHEIEAAFRRKVIATDDSLPCSFEMSLLCIFFCVYLGFATRNNGIIWIIIWICV